MAGVYSAGIIQMLYQINVVPNQGCIKSRLYQIKVVPNQGFIELLSEQVLIILILYYHVCDWGVMIHKCQTQ